LQQRYCGGSPRGPRGLGPLGAYKRQVKVACLIPLADHFLHVSIFLQQASSLCALIIDQAAGRASKLKLNAEKKKKKKKNKRICYLSIKYLKKRFKIKGYNK